MIAKFYLVELKDLITSMHMHYDAVRDGLEVSTSIFSGSRSNTKEVQGDAVTNIFAKKI